MLIRMICLAVAGMMVAFAGRQSRGEQYEVFILSGQSNMDGRAKIAELVGPLEKWKLPQEDVKFAYSNSGIRGVLLTSKGWEVVKPGFSVPPNMNITSLPGPTFGPEITFGRTMVEKMPGKKIAIIKYVEGGTSLQTQWMPGEKGKIYDTMVAFVNKSLGELTAKGDTYAIRGFAWHQGESDATLTQAEYAGLLKNLVTRVRADLQVPALPVAIGEIYDNGEKNKAVRAAQKEVGETVAGCAFVPVTGLLTFDQGVHFDVPGQLELGRRFAEAIWKLNGGKQDGK